MGDVRYSLEVVSLSFSLSHSQLKGRHFNSLSYQPSAAVWSEQLNSAVWTWVQPGMCWSHATWGQLGRDTLALTWKCDMHNLRRAGFFCTAIASFLFTYLVKKSKFSFVIVTNLDFNFCKSYLDLELSGSSFYLKGIFLKQIQILE
jgi:hypothetical protein